MIHSYKAVRDGRSSAFAVMTLLFFMWGFLTCMNDILIPYLKGVFQLSHFEAMMIQFCFFGAYFIGSLLYFIISATNGDPINKIGYKNGMVTGLTLAGVGCLLFYPAAELVSYPLFLSALFVMGLGFTLLQISANPYVAILGNPDGASARLNLSQAFNSLGTTIAPIIGGYLIFKYFAKDISGSADSVKVPYLIFAGIFMLLALFFNKIKLPSFSNHNSLSKGLSILKFRHLKLGMIAIFMYVGAEVCIGSMLINYLKLPHIAGLDEIGASTFVALYWGGLMIGRFIGGISLSNYKRGYTRYLLIFAAAVGTSALILYIAHLKDGMAFMEMLPYFGFLALLIIGFLVGGQRPAKTLFIFSVVNEVLLLITISTSGAIAIWTVVAIGMFNSIMWSNIFTLAIAGLEEKTSQASSLLIMMIAGGAILPLIQGYIADSATIQISFIVPLVAFIYISFYSLWGYKKRLSVA